MKILTWLFLAILLPGCVPGPKDTPEPFPASDDHSTAVGRRPATFTETYRWSDGLALEIVEVTHTRLLPSTPVDAPTAQPGDPCTELTVVVRNGSDRPARITLTARLRYGPELSPSATYVATVGHADHSTAQFVDPGGVSYPYTLGFVLPADMRNHVILDLGIDNSAHQRAVFAGSVAE